MGTTIERGIRGILKEYGDYGCGDGITQARGRGGPVPCADGGELLPPAERHGAVDAAVHLSDPEKLVPSGFWADRVDHLDQSDYSVAAAAVYRALYGPEAHAVLIARRDDGDFGRVDSGRGGA
jgi:hypothetical protein